MRTLFGGIAVAMLVICAAAHATSLNDLIIGKTEAGPNHAMKDLKGKVVLVVFWGTH